MWVYQSTNKQSAVQDQRLDQWFATNNESHLVVSGGKIENDGSWKKQQNEKIRPSALNKPLEPPSLMPYVNIQITIGATRTQKANLVRDITDSLVRELGKKPEHIHIVIQEIEDENWGFAGLLTDDWKRLQSDPPGDEA